MLDNRHKSAPSFTWQSVLGLVVKVLITCGLLYALHKQVLQSGDFSTLLQEIIGGMTLREYGLLVFATLLMPVNLVLEALKFNLLLNDLPHRKALTLRTGLRRVLAGLSVGIMTPNRVGEYAGRMAGALPGERSSIVSATLLGGIAQWIPLLVGGGLAALSFYTTSTLQGAWLAPVLWASLLVLTCFGVSYLYLPAAIRLLTKLPLLARLAERLETQSQFSGSARGGALGFAIARYSIYLTQLSLAFAAFGMDLPAFELVAGTAILLLAQAFIPLPSVVQALARTELAVLIWSAASPNVLGLGAASLFIFVLNLGLPALVGLVIILRTDVKRSLLKTAT